mmetsp:Transcript_2075/g.2762  ORF Transcript_2075/g.2762 Transcript_2075/m.2762 type:complete len:133 (-) Transcript_2075:129-527(-)
MNLNKNRIHEFLNHKRLSSASNQSFEAKHFLNRTLSLSQISSSSSSSLSSSSSTSSNASFDKQPVQHDQSQNNNKQHNENQNMLGKNGFLKTILPPIVSKNRDPSQRIGTLRTRAPLMWVDDDTSSDNDDSL